MKKDLYFTNDHEWIEYRGTVAYTGICSFKLKGIKDVREISFNEPEAIKKQGDRIATIFYDDYEIAFSMPVNGRLMNINELIITDNRLVLQQPEGNGWIALIAPAQPYERKDLLLPQEYRLNGKGKYAK